MQSRLDELKKEYDLEKEFSRIKVEIGKVKPKTILLQFPDGLKPYATEIVDNVQKIAGEKTLVKIWLGDCFGACDIPNSKSDLLIQFGHAPWK
jgi:2-(3-amino-3-carboxypropyl)histidine synthase